MKEQPQQPGRGAALIVTTAITLMVSIWGVPLAVFRLQHRGATTGAYVFLIVMSALAMAAGYLTLRLARGFKTFTSERTKRATLIASLTASLLLMSVGRFLAFPDTVFDRNVGEFGGFRQVYDWGLYVGGALLVVAILVPFITLSLNPSTERELKRRLDVEASTVALGTCLFVFLAYQGLEDVFRFPKFSEGVAMLTILATYVLARLVLSIRYR